MIVPKTYKLEANKVLLRNLKIADYPFLKDILNHKPTMRALIPYFKIEKWSDELVVKRYEKFSENQRQSLGLTYIVLDKDSGKVVGDCGFKNIDANKRCAEFGIILHKKVWGRGHALECHLLCLEYGFENLKFNFVYFQTDKWNHRMNSFFKKIDVPYIRTTDEGYLYYELQKQLWPQTKLKLKTLLNAKQSS